MSKKGWLGVIMLGAALASSSCLRSPLVSVDVEEGRKILFEETQDIEMSLPGVIREEAKVKQVVSWELAFSKPGDTTQSVTLQCQKVDINGNSLGGAYSSLDLKEALSRLSLTLVIDRKGKTLSYSEADLSGSDQATQRTAAALTAPMKALGPLGIIFPAEPLKPGVKWSASSDLSLIAGFLSSSEDAPEGSYEHEFEHVKDINVKGRAAAVIKVKEKGSLRVLLSLKGASSWVEAKLESTGEIVVDRRTGLPFSRTYTSTATADLGTGVLTQKVKGSWQLKSSPE